MPIQIHTNRKLDLVYSDAAAVFFEAVSSIRGDHVVVALPGGRSIVPFIDEIVARAEELPLNDWHRLEFFMVDERAVPLTDDASNFRLVALHLSQLIDELIIRERQLHPYRHRSGDEAGALEAYEDELRRFGGAFDIVCLGAGEDGHIAGLFPQHHSISEAARGYLYFEDSPKPPPIRVTASRKMIAQASVGLLFFVGEGKSEAYRNFRSSELSVEHCPAKILEALSQGHVFTNLSID